MSTSYTKLFSSITESTIVSEPVPTRWLWVTMLAMADSTGSVHGSIPGLARRANLSIEETEAGLRTFLSPDPYSRTKDHDGRRIVEIDGGWRLLNHAKYKEIRSESERTEYKRQWDREHRAKRPKQPSDNPTKSDSNPTVSDTSDRKPINPTRPTPPAPALAPEEQEQSSLRSDSSAGEPLLTQPPSNPADLAARNAARLSQVTADAIAAYNATLAKPDGALPRVSSEVGRDKRRQNVQRCIRVARDICRKVYGDPTITAVFWADYFGEVAKDDFLSGRQRGGKDHENWKPSFEFLTREATMLKVFDQSEAAA